MLENSPPSRFSWKTCSDGSQTLFDSLLGESFKSTHAAQTESHAVFVTPGVLEHHRWSSKAPFQILELGFGVGTNFRSLHELSTKSGKEIIFTSIEKDLSGVIHFCKTSDQLEITKNLVEHHFIHKNKFQAKLLLGDFFQLLQTFSPQSFDCIFFDPFSPKTNPEAWSAEIFQECFRVLKENGRLVTYSVSRIAKDGLCGAGFQITKRDLPEILQKRSSLLAEKVEKGSK